MRLPNCVNLALLRLGTAQIITYLHQTLDVGSMTQYALDDVKCADVKNYKIREGTETVEKLAFVGCDKLECLYIPYTCPEESFDAILGGSDTVGAICFWDKPYVPKELDPNESWSDDEVFIDDKDVVYTIDRKRLLYARKGFMDNEYFVPEGTLTICDQAFFTENVQNAQLFIVHPNE